MKLDHRENSTILAALRWWQACVCPSSEAIEIATDGGEIEPLTLLEIDALCERINFDDEAASTARLPHEVQVRVVGGGGGEWWETIAAFDCAPPATSYARECQLSNRRSVYRVVVGAEKAA